MVSLRRKKKQEKEEVTSFTSFDRLSPEVNMIMTLRELEVELFEMEKHIKALMEKRGLVLDERNKILRHLQAPRPALEGLNEVPIAPSPKGRPKKVVSDGEEV